MASPSNISFLLAMLVTNEIAIQTTMQTYTFLKTILNQYPNKIQWDISKSSIENALDSFQRGLIHPPYLNLKTRTAAIKEMKLWSALLRDLTNT
jgi:hypothetical protein